MNFKIDFTFCLAALSLLVAIIKIIYDIISKKNDKQLQAIENVYQYAHELYYYPFILKRKLKYINKDKEIEKYVRKYLESTSDEFYFNYKNFYPNRLKTISSREKFMNKVIEEANSFLEFGIEQITHVNLYERSPVSHLNEKEYKDKFNELLKIVNAHITSFPKGIQKLTKQILFMTYDEVKSEYLSALRVCPDYFIHNKRNFKDPYYDIISEIVSFYKRKTESPVTRIKNKIIHYFIKLKNKFKSLMYRRYYER